MEAPLDKPGMGDHGTPDKDAPFVAPEPTLEGQSEDAPESDEPEAEATA